MRPTSSRSATTTAPLGTSFSRMDFSRAWGPNSTSTLRISSAMGKGAGVCFRAPLSMREISSSADMISSTALSEASIEWANSARLVPPARSTSVEV